MPDALPRGPSLPWPVQTLLWVRRPTEFLRRCRSDYGSAFTIKLPPREIVMFTEPEDIKRIFAARGDEMHAGEFNGVLRPVVGPSSVLVLDGREHMRHRKVLLPPFHGERMRLYGETMRDIALADIETWPLEAPFSLHSHMQSITLDIILRTVFGLEGAELSELRARIKKLLALGELPVSVPILSFLSARPGREREAPWKWLLRDRRRVDEALYRQIAARRAERATSERTDVLALLIAARDEDGDPLTDSEIRDELITALAAGHETTASALCWVFERILSEPRVHERLLAEVDGLSGRVPRPEEVARLEYLDATLKEVLRLRPILPVVGRVLKETTTLGGRRLPPGTAVAACIYLAHLNPETYPDPEAFRPERFLGVKEDPSTWLPFGGGIRRCLGAAFAFYEMKIVTATILAARHLRLAQPSPARVVRRAITFSPEHGTRVVASSRKRP